MRRLFTTLLTLALTIPFANTYAAGGDDESYSDVPGELLRFAGNIHQFNSIFPQEKVYLQFDNTSYYTGETIWYKAFVVNASTLQRAESKVLYVDFISPTGVVLEQQKLKIVGGQADGTIILVDGSTSQAREVRGTMNYPSGFYEIRAYTNYMLNFNPETIFSRVLAVYERPKMEGYYFEESPVIKLHKTDLNEPRPEPEKLRRINCTFYPEGGHLVKGQPNRVAFKVTDDTGLGIDAKGTVDGTRTKVSTQHDGMGSFTVTPGDRRISVTLTLDGKNHTFTLPAAEKEGISMSVTQSSKDKLTIELNSTPSLTGKTLGMALTCRGEIVDFCTIETGQGNTRTTRSMDGIPEGVCRINIFDADGTLYASRALYHHSQALKTPRIEVTPDKKEYAPFERINLKFQLKDGQGNPFRDRFCLSVRDTRGQGNILADDLRTSLLLSSDLKGYIENPSWYFDTNDADRDAALDLLMLVQGWERYDWQTITGQKEYRERHRVERSLTLNGWIMNSNGRKPLKDVEVLAALTPTDKSQLETYTYTTDTSGYFGFDIGVEYYGKARFTIDAHAKRNRLIGPSARIVFDRSMLPAIRAYQPQELVFTGLTPASAKGKKRKKEADKYPTIIDIDKGILLPDVDIEAERVLTDYYAFNAYDVVKDVEVELDKGEYSTDLYGYLLEKGYSVSHILSHVIVSGLMEKKETQMKDTLMLCINGFVPFFYVHDSHNYLHTGRFVSSSADDRLEIDTKDIKSIMIYDRPMWLWDIYQNCPLYMDYLNKTMQNIDFERLTADRRLLIDVLIKEPEELSTRDDRFKINKRVTTVDGYTPPYAFYAPEYPDGPVAGDIDYRRTLYWNPNVITDSIGQASVEFYNNSITEHFNVSAAGITPGGTPYVLDTDF